MRERVQGGRREHEAVGDVDQEGVFLISQIPIVLLVPYGTIDGDAGKTRMWIRGGVITDQSGLFT